MWAESIPNLSRNLVAVFKEVVNDLSSRSDTPLSLAILPHLFAMWKSPYPIACALGELAVNQDRNATDALRQQLTFETNGWPILSIELLIHFWHNDQSVGNQRAEVEPEFTTGADQPAGLPTMACCARC